MQVIAKGAVMRIKSPATVTTLAVGSVFAGISMLSAAQVPRATDAQLVAALNDCIQERFKDVDEQFGIRRIVRIGDGPHRFKPESARELSAVRDLERARLRVVLYLAGRRVLQPRPDVPLPDVTIGLQPIKGPVLVAPAVVATPDAPASMTLWDESARAMRAFERADIHNFAVGAWKFTAHPVRASDPMCLRCHSADGSASMWSRPAPEQSLRIGDALGVVLYGVQTR
jgi:hypothetical protein